MNPVVELAREKIKRSAHWTVQGDLLWQIEDGGLWREAGDHGSFRAWAMDDLGVSPAQLTELLKARRLAMQFEPCVRFPDEWAPVSFAAMRQLRRIIPGKTPAEAREWILKAVASKGASELERSVDAALNKEPWTTWRVPVPGDLEEILEEMLVRVLPDVLGKPPQSTTDDDRARVRDRDIRFRCLERVAAFVLALYEPGKDGGTTA